LYVRHLGWLHATPEGSDKSRLAGFREKDENHPALRLPDIESEFAAGYLVAMLQEAGLMSSSGMGPVPLSWQEIESWMRCTETQITVWERLTIKGMSEDYVGEYLAARKKDRPAPYTYVDPDEELEEQRKEVATKLLNAFRMFKRAPVEDEQKESQ
jgi:hypothetical protein